MNITYVEHSCFTIEIENAVFIFDYYKGNLPDFEKDKQLYVFSSHVHPDHFNFSIFELSKMYENVEYILSKDIKKKYNRNYFLNKILAPRSLTDAVYEHVHYMDANEDMSIDELKIHTLKSTDQGVAFVIQAYGKSIYHAGDLHWWTWNGATRRENDAMGNAFMAEIAKIEGTHFDVAFLPLDPRQEDKFYLGFDYFMKHTDTDVAYPMHFWGDSSVIGRLKKMPCAKEYSHKIVEISD